MTEDTPLTFESPESSAVAGASYEPDTRTMLVYLRRKEGVISYRYGDVPEDIWRDFWQATSKGQYFAQRIRPMFAGRAA